MNGLIALVGSGEYLETMGAVDRCLLAQARRAPPVTVVCVPAAAGQEGDAGVERWMQMGVKHFTSLGAYVQAARINWGHICIAALMKEGYVDRILTVNFDPLIARACALLGEYPAVYDFAASQHFKPDFVSDKAVFHLHGQMSGFVLLNTDAEIYGGSGQGNFGGQETKPSAEHGRPQSLTLTLPPLAAIFLGHESPTQGRDAE